MVVRARLGARCPTQWLQCWWVGRGLQGCDSGQNVMVSVQGPGAITDWNFNVFFFFQRSSELCQWEGLVGSWLSGRAT